MDFLCPQQGKNANKTPHIGSPHENTTYTKIVTSLYRITWYPRKQPWILSKLGNMCLNPTKESLHWKVWKRWLCGHFIRFMEHSIRIVFFVAYQLLSVLLCKSFLHSQLDIQKNPYLCHVNNSGDLSSIHYIRFQYPSTWQNLPSHCFFTRVRHGCIIDRLNSQNRQVLLHKTRCKDDNLKIFMRIAMFSCLPWGIFLTLLT